jgi:hypothetical protein
MHRPHSPVHENARSPVPHWPFGGVPDGGGGDGAPNSGGGDGDVNVNGGGDGANENGGGLGVPPPVG